MSTISSYNDARESPGHTDAVRWAPRVNPSLIRRLYESDARGLLDDDLLSKVGFALWARCQSVLEAYQAHEDGRMVCPGCGGLIVHQSRAREQKGCPAGLSEMWLERAMGRLPEDLPAQAPARWRRDCLLR